MASILLFAALVFGPSAFTFDRQGQERKPGATDTQKKEDGKVPTEKELEKSRKKQEQAPLEKISQAEALAELTIFAYGGRPNLQTARAAIQ